MTQSRPHAQDMQHTAPTAGAQRFVSSGHLVAQPGQAAAELYFFELSAHRAQRWVAPARQAGRRRRAGAPPLFASLASMLGLGRGRRRASRRQVRLTAVSACCGWPPASPGYWHWHLALLPVSPDVAGCLLANTASYHVIPYQQSAASELSAVAEHAPGRGPGADPMHCAALSGRGGCCRRD